MLGKPQKKVIFLVATKAFPLFSFMQIALANCNYNLYIFTAQVKQIIKDFWLTQYIEKCKAKNH